MDSTLTNDIALLKEMVTSLLLRISTLEKENEGLRFRLSSVEKENEGLHSQIFLLSKENEELRSRLNLTSKTSNKPPSSDGYKKEPAFPREKGKKKGGQKEHKGSHLSMVSLPDEIILHAPTSCTCCGRFFETTELTISQKRQVFDIPPIRLHVVEHQIGRISCCNQLQTGTFPTSLTAPVQYGERILSLSSLLNVSFGLAYNKINTFFSDLFQCSFNVSTSVSANETLYNLLAPYQEEIIEHICDSQVAHFDESGMRVAGSLHWFHTASTDLFCHLFVHKRRGAVALDSEESPLTNFKNWAIHDCWASYFNFENCKHAVCNAHILRELAALKEKESVWATKMHKFLLALYRATQKGTGKLKNPTLWIRNYEKICEKADEEEPLAQPTGRGKPKNTKGRNLLTRLKKYQNEVLAFALHQEVPFTNNLAERDIREIKVKQKIATSFRTLKGAKVYARILSFIKSLRKQKINVFTALQKIHQGIKVEWKVAT
jgi:transposase